MLNIMRATGLALCLSSAIALAACGTDEPADITGPFTGATRRYVVDAITLPMTTSDARAAADDLDGDGTVDNAVGNAIASLAQQGDVSLHGADMIASGVIASSVEIVADDLTDDDTVSVTYHGHDGDATVEVGGKLVDGRFVSNRTRSTSHPGSASVVLPVFIDADPTTLAVSNVEIDLEADGSGGYNATVRGTTDPAQTIAAAWTGASQMLSANPQDHLAFLYFVDTSGDGLVNEAEFSNSFVIQNSFTSDIRVDGNDVLSFGLQLHLSPCDAGSCISGPPADLCHDRVLDGDETGLDCGGSCIACAGGEACAIATDCQSQSCDSSVCAAPSCDDGLRDGFENGVDCGGACSTDCP
jgi:hypothetical protein